MSETRAIIIVAIAVIVGFGIFGGGSTSSTSSVSSKPVEPAAEVNRATTPPSDPCGWALRPSSMTREQCERLSETLADLADERERRTNPNYRGPFSAIH